MSGRWISIDDHEAGLRRMTAVHLKANVLHRVDARLALLAGWRFVFGGRSRRTERSMQAILNCFSQLRGVLWFRILVVVLFHDELHQIAEVGWTHVVAEQMTDEPAAGGRGQFHQVLFVGGWCQLTQLLQAQPGQQHQADSLYQAD